MKTKRGVTTLRSVQSSDEVLLYDWQNERGSRVYLRDPTVPSATEHSQWFKKRLSVPNGMFWVIQSQNAELENIDVGCIRLEPYNEKNTFEVSIFVSESFRGRGLAVSALRQICREYNSLKIIACVHKKNKFSNLVFLKAGFFLDCNRNKKGADEWVWFVNVE
jgi:RimJ/RimL family protein N-acetyltransferase